MQTFFYRKKRTSFFHVFVGFCQCHFLRITPKSDKTKSAKKSLIFPHSKPVPKWKSTKKHEKVTIFVPFWYTPGKYQESLFKTEKTDQK